MWEHNEKNSRKKIDSTNLIEFYCNKCDESITFYPTRDKVKSGHAVFSKTRFFT